MQRIIHISDISYSIPEAIILTIAIELALLPIIIYAKRHCPILLGKNSVSIKGCHSQIHNK